MDQKFYACPEHTQTWPNGAVGFKTGEHCTLGPYAKVVNCPVAGTDLRLTCYASNYPDTFFSIPANTRYRGKYIKGYFTINNDGVEFRVMNSHQHLINEIAS